MQWLRVGVGTSRRHDFDDKAVVGVASICRVVPISVVIGLSVALNADPDLDCRNQDIELQQHRLGATFFDYFLIEKAIVRS